MVATMAAAGGYPMSSNDPKAWMWAEACGLVERAERLQRQFFRVSAQAVWEPPVDIFEIGAEHWIVAALPGVPPAAMEITLSGNIVRIRAERPLPAGLRQGAVKRLEIPYGRFERTIELPGSQFELRAHEALHGCLIIQLHKLF
jgi:HSP20 family molecular chaperone IbpA